MDTTAVSGSTQKKNEQTARKLSRGTEDTRRHLWPTRRTTYSKKKRNLAADTCNWRAQKCSLDRQTLRLETRKRGVI